MVCVNEKQFSCVQKVNPPQVILYQNYLVHVGAAIITINVVCGQFITITLGIVYSLCQHFVITLPSHCPLYVITILVSFYVQK
jgi:hypothetical protein